MGCPLGYDNHTTSDQHRSDSPIEKEEDSRIISSIPKSIGINWTYPSPKMFLRSLWQKGHSNLDARQVAQIVLPIHNIVNEKCWSEICKWERLMNGITNPQQELVLVRFVGRPDRISLKAALQCYLLGCKRPFDRHDWYVSTKGGTPKRYIIDFYQGRSDDHSPVSVHIDVRPALDFKNTFSYIKGYFGRWKSNKILQ